MERTKEEFVNYKNSDFLFSLGLYDTFKLDLFSIQKEHGQTYVGSEDDPQTVQTISIKKSPSFIKLIDFINECENVYNYCTMCNVENSFKVESSYSFPPALTNNYFCKDEIFSYGIELEEINTLVADATRACKSQIGEILNDKTMFYFSKTLTCCHCTDHIYEFYFMVKKDDNNSVTFTKIGQYPSFLDLHIAEAKKYKPILKGTGYDREFTRALGLYSNGVGVGSYVYLRRILEDLVNNIAEKAISEGKISQDEFDYIITEEANDENTVEHKDQTTKQPRKRSRRFNEKIQLLSGELPSKLVENANLYSIISIGIHSMPEEKCLKHSELLQQSILYILEEAYQQQKKKEDEETWERALFKIKTKE